MSIKECTYTLRVTGPGVPVSLPGQLSQKSSSSCIGYVLTQGLCLQGPSGPSALSLLRGPGINSVSLDNTVPSAHFPSSLVILLNSTHTVLKKEGTDEVQLLANAGIPPCQASELYPHTRTAGGHIPTWDTELGPQAGSRPVHCP